jgi:hypothetical protein
MIADWHLDDAIASNEPPAEELGKCLYNTWAWEWTAVVEAAAGVEVELFFG